MLWSQVYSGRYLYIFTHVFDLNFPYKFAFVSHVWLNLSMSNRLPNILTFGLAAGVLATTPAQAEPDEIRLASWTPPIEKIDESPRTKEDPLKPTSRYDVIDYLRPDQIMRAREQGTGELSETQLKLFEVFEERAEWAAGIPADNVGIYTVRMKRTPFLIRLILMVTMNM